MFQKAIPILPAINIMDTIEFYANKLGFTGVNFGNYGILKYHDVEIHLQAANSKKRFERVSCFILVNNVEDLYAELAAKEIIYPKGKLEKKPTGFKEFCIVDNNGNTIHFGQKQ